MRRNFILFLLIITAAIGTYLFLNQSSCFNAPDLNRTFYKKALEAEQKGNFKEAYYSYKKVSPFYCAYDGVLYHQSDCAANIEDEKTAIKKLETLISKCPKSKLVPAAYYKLGQAYIRTNQPRLAEKTFRKLAKKYPHSEYRIAAYYYVGIINQKRNPKYAISLWKKYLSLAPSGRFALDCIKELSSHGAILNNNDRINIGLAYYFAGKKSSAINQLQNLPTTRSWYYLAKCYAQTNQKDKAMATIKNGLIYNSKNIPRDNLYEAIKLYSRLDSKPSKDSWNELANFSRNTKAYDYALYNLAKASPKSQEISIYNKIVKSCPRGEYTPEALWELMWNAYRTKQYAKAINLAELHEQKFTNNDTSAKVLFWKGKALEKQYQKHQAIKCYDKLKDDFDTTYYAFRANGRIKALQHRKDPQWSVHSSNRINKSFFDSDDFYPGYKIYTKYGETFLELLKTNDYDLIAVYDIDDDFLNSWINHKKGLYQKSCILARNVVDESYPKPKINEGICKLAFPLHYIEEINSAGRENRLDSALIISLVKEESCFNSGDISSAQAIGLMQLLPTTATHIATKKGLPYTGTKNLLNAKTNIRLGSTYLKDLYEETGNMLYAVASYNAGPGNVQKWISSNNSDDLDEFVENIPYPETQNYIKKVYRSYWCYSRLY